MISRLVHGEELTLLMVVLMHVDKLQFQFAKKKKRDKKSAVASDSKKLYSSNGSLVSASGKTHLGGGDGNAISESDIERAIISAAAAAGGE